MVTQNRNIPFKYFNPFNLVNSYPNLKGRLRTFLDGFLSFILLYSSNFVGFRMVHVNFKPSTAG